MLADLGGRPIERLPPAAPACGLTVDVEDWFHSSFRSAPALDESRLPRRVETAVARLLEAVAAHGARATFFVLGCVAREHPRLARRIADAGHEVGCHGMTHACCYDQTPEAFRAATHDARSLLADQSGQPVWGFRAPSWSVTPRSLWALDVAAELGFRYDSSIFPAATYLYGITDAPRSPYVVRTRSGLALVEVPPSVVAFGPVTFGVGGGFYLRLLPWWVHRRAMQAHAKRGDPFLAYVHPREFDADSVAAPAASFVEQFIHASSARPAVEADGLLQRPLAAAHELLAQRGIPRCAA
jgi:polysaccharide deacetylase family protein (PEP-CTERM system associated)